MFGQWVGGILWEAALRAKELKRISRFKDGVFQGHPKTEVSEGCREGGRRRGSQCLAIHGSAQSRCVVFRGYFGALWSIWKALCYYFGTISGCFEVILGSFSAILGLFQSHFGAIWASWS